MPASRQQGGVSEASALGEDAERTERGIPDRRAIRKISLSILSEIAILRLD
jgi:hypothetical protein